MLHLVLRVTSSTTRPSLLALVHIARNCRHLQSLRLSQLMHHGDVPHETGVTPHDLSKLDTSNWEVDRAELDTFIAALFPKARVERI